MQSDVVLRVVSKFLIPFILLFAFYVQFHGDFSPGGGFQAGVILAAGIILYALVFGVAASFRIVPMRATQIGAAIGVMIYGGTGVVSLLRGARYLDYNALAHDPVHGQHLGIFMVELGVGIGVASTMLWLFYSFTSHKLRRDGQS